MRRLAIGLMAALALSPAVSPAAADHGSPALVSTGPGGGNGAFDAGAAQLSRDGAAAVFTTRESLIGTDADSSVDVYKRVGGTTTLVSGGSNGAFDATLLRVSDPGDHVVFSTAEQLSGQDTDSASDIYMQTPGGVELVSGGPGDTGQSTPAPWFLDMTADGSRILFRTVEPLSASDTDTSQDIYERTSGVNTLVSTGPVNGAGAAEEALFAAAGARIFFGTSAGLVSGDNDGSSDIYERTAGITTLVTPGVQQCWYEQGCERASLVDVSESGDRIIFQTNAYLAGTDGDSCGYDDVFEVDIGCYDIYERSGGTYRQVSTGSTNGGDDFEHWFVAASADASYVLFESFANLMPTDQDGFVLDAYLWHAGITTHISTPPGGSSGGHNVEGASRLSEDGQRAFFATRERLTPDDTDGFADVYEHSNGTLKLVSTAPGTGNGAANASLSGISADGARVFFSTYERLLPTDTDFRNDVYERILAQHTAQVSAGSGPFNAAFSDAGASGEAVLYSTGEQLAAGDTDASADLYRTDVPGGFPRPSGATQTYFPLVRAYAACASPDREHGPPLAFASCSAPTQASGHLTVGTPDANGQTAKSTGSVRYDTIRGDPGTPTDEADVRFTLRLDDVRQASGLADYAGELELRTAVRVTDRRSGPGADEPATFEDFEFPVTVPCAATPDTTVGSTCAVVTSAEAVTPGSITEGARSIWAFGQARVYDGGPDGVAATQDNTLFAVQGVFVP